MKIVYLTPKSSFRNKFSSDSLWGLICWGIKNLYSEKKLEEFLDSYNRTESDLLKISSAFPFKINGNRKVLYFPKPQLKPLDWNKYFSGKTKEEKLKALRNLKDFKKIKLIPDDLFIRFLSGDLSEVSFFENDTLWLKKNDSDDFKFINQEILHNTIDKHSNSTLEKALYTKSETFTKNAGYCSFYFPAAKKQ